MIENLFISPEEKKQAALTNEALLLKYGYPPDEEFTFGNPTDYFFTRKFVPQVGMEFKFYKPNRQKLLQYRMVFFENSDFVAELIRTQKYFTYQSQKLTILYDLETTAAANHREVS